MTVKQLEMMLGDCKEGAEVWCDVGFEFKATGVAKKGNKVYIRGVAPNKKKKGKLNGKSASNIQTR